LSPPQWYTPCPNLRFGLLGVFGALTPSKIGDRLKPYKKICTKPGRTLWSKITSMPTDCEVSSSTVRYRRVMLEWILLHYWLVTLVRQTVWPALAALKARFTTSSACCLMSLYRRRVGDAAAGREGKGRDGHRLCDVTRDKIMTLWVAVGIMAS